MAGKKTRKEYNETTETVTGMTRQMGFKEKYCLGLKLKEKKLKGKNMIKEK